MDERPRIPLVETSSDPTVQQVFARKEAEVGRVPHIYQALANAPLMLKAWADIAYPLRYDATTPRDLRELVILRVAHLREAPFELAAHTRLAREASLAEEKIDAVAEWRAADVFTATERAALDLADAMTTSNQVPDEVMARVRERFGPGETVELVLTVGFYQCVSTVLAAFALH